MSNAEARVLVEDRNDTRWIRLNAPERRNAYDQAMAESIADGPGIRRRRA